MKEDKDIFDHKFNTIKYDKLDKYKLKESMHQILTVFI